MLSPEVRDLRGVGADDKRTPNIADHGQEVRHTFALVAGLRDEAFLASPGSICGIHRLPSVLAGAEHLTVLFHHRLERSWRSAKDCLDMGRQPVVAVCGVQMRHRQ